MNTYMEHIYVVIGRGLAKGWLMRMNHQVDGEGRKVIFACMNRKLKLWK